MVAWTRRSLLGVVGAAAASTLVPPSPLGAASGDAPPLPPPLPADVFRDRQSRLRAAAKARNLDALFVTPSTNLAWAANLAIGRSERLTALLLFAEGPSVLITPSFEEANHKRTAVADEVRTWNEDEDPLALTAKILAGRKVVGVEGTTAYQTATALASAAGAKLEEGTPVFDSLRMIKSADEQAFVRDAARRTNLAIDGAHKRMRGGMTESELARILEEEFTKQGVRGGGLVQFGPSSAFPHGGPAERRLAKGDPVLIDAGCRVHGYSSDITRTVSFGPPSDELRKVYDIVDRAQVAGIGMLKAGTSGEDADRAARKVIEDAGYGQFFTHRLGHGLGMDGHEPPYLVRGNAKPLSTGNVVTAEPGIYMPGKFGVRIEDDYAVRDTFPPASLSSRPGELKVIGA
ncbi:MAG: Xaa-Pro peptidase family protein [Acidobacteriota bacterium]|nr:Xaa-Pro peptidase family protein [Acidobacteriota bacterium]